MRAVVVNHCASPIQGAQRFAIRRTCSAAGRLGSAGGRRPGGCCCAGLSLGRAGPACPRGFPPEPDEQVAGCTERGPVCGLSWTVRGWVARETATKFASSWREESVTRLLRNVGGAGVRLACRSVCGPKAIFSAPGHGHDPNGCFALTTKRQSYGCVSPVFPTRSSPHSVSSPALRAART